MTNSIEATGITLDAAIEKGLKDLGLTSKDQVTVKVLKDNGFLFNKYKILITKKESESEIAIAYVETLLEKMGFNFVVEAQEDEERITLNLIGTDSASVIGYRGEVLDSIQYLTGLASGKNKESFKRITIDTENYRQKRAEVLAKLAHNLESKVKRMGKTVKLEPMNPFERRVIHATLQDSEFVTTLSEGVSPYRYITIIPKFPKNQTERKPNGNNNRNRNPRSNGNKRERTEPVVTESRGETASSTENTSQASSKRTTMNFVYSSEKKRRRNPMSK